MAEQKVNISRTTTNPLQSKYNIMASESLKKLSATEQSDISKFLQSQKIHTIGCYTLGKTIGEGSFGKVKLGTHNLIGQQVAVKIVNKIYAPQLVREIETWRQLKHPNIVQLYEVLTSETKIYMVCEYCEGGEMLDFITSNGKMDDHDIKTKNVFLQIASAVACCHEKNFAHRDLKLENILMKKDGTIKLIDFGFTRWANDAALLDTYCGSSAYCAPEIVEGTKYTGPEADIWSLGVVLFTMVAGYLPFDAENDAETHKQIKEIDYTLPDFLHEDTKDLISRIFQKEPSNRITMSEIMNHPWLHSLGARKLNLTSGPPKVRRRESKLGKSYNEMMLAAKLEAIGFNVPEILQSVHADACNQSSALWHLLLEKGNSASASSLVGSPVSTMSGEKSFEVNLKELDKIFETTQKQPASSAQNPLLQMASVSEEPLQIKIDTPWTMDSSPLVSPAPKNSSNVVVAGSRRKTKELTVSPVTASNTGVQSPNQLNSLRSSRKKLYAGITEEEESAD